MDDLIAYGGLFLFSLGAATILPVPSETVLVSLLLADYSPWLLLAAASTGNVLGSTINWLLGRAIERYGSNHRWFPEGTLARARGWYHRYGRWSLLLSWMPLVGDPLTIVAGVLRERLAVFLLFVTVAKVGRYLAVIGVARWFS
ncbi:YqaA family protein [Reyranella sp.]|uniref:YqaA family protein n=1 Tax=Reyranella sp. TaxID=1929291 RepID=UPI003D11C99C